jgi:phosphoglycerate dehydrogenase-like enzyme
MIKAVFMLRENDSILLGERWKFIHKIYNEDSIGKICKFAEVFPQLITRVNMEEHKEYLKEVEVVFSTWGMPDLSEEEIGQYLPKLKALFYGAGSVQAFARPFLNKNITVLSAWAANAVPVAEYTTAQILLANKGFHQNALLAKKSRKSANEFSQSFPGNYSVKVGILGAGMIGTKVIEFLKPFNIQVMVYDPYLSDERAEKLEVEKCTLAEIFSECQTISNHIANIPATQGLLNHEHFNNMLPNATFINTGRGAQVVEEDLIKALKAVPTRTALLDVTFPEPPMPDSEFLKMNNVILTTHIAGSMSCEVARMGCYIADEFVNYISNKELKYKVTKNMLETMA